MLANIKRAARLFRAPVAADLEFAYVSQATDRFDLEARERDIDRGMFRSRAFAR